MSVPHSLQSPYAPLARPPTAARPLHVVLACTGSVASVKVPLLAERLVSMGHVHVHIVATGSALHFFERRAVEQLDPSGASYSAHDLAEANRTGAHGHAPPRVRVWTDEDEWAAFTKIGDPVLHIELRRWADIVLVAPCDANTLAKIANGLCDNVLTCMMRALSPTTPTLLFPAMNTLMYLHPITQTHTDAARALGYEVHGPISKRLACGDVGTGAMLEWTAIAQLIQERYM